MSDRVTILYKIGVATLALMQLSSNGFFGSFLCSPFLFIEGINIAYASYFLKEYRFLKWKQSFCY